MKKKQKYWYATYIEACVLCGREKKIRERVYIKKERGIHYTEFACGEHFM